jgi:hypothetical protein
VGARFALLRVAPEKYHEDEAVRSVSQARHAQIDMLMKVVPVLNELLTADQKRKLPQLVVNVPRSALSGLDSRRHVALRRRQHAADLRFAFSAAAMVEMMAVMR